LRFLFILLLFLAACGEGDALVRAEQALVEDDLLRAEENFRQVLDSSPDNVDALYGLGWVYHLNHKSNRARDYFMRCLRVNAADHRGYKGLGSLALAEGNFQVSKLRFDEALKRAPGDPAVLNSMALLELAAGRFESARDLLKPLVEQFPTRGELGLNLAESYFRLKDYDPALKTIEQSLAQDLENERFRGILHQLRSLILVRLTAGRLDLKDCAGTLPPLIETLAMADKELDVAESLGRKLPDLPAARLRVHRRRSRILQDCPLESIEVETK
jgi:Flp pilus assembly protein TadD